MDGGRQEGRGREIALDIARGLAFLHQMQLIHFDVKSPNGAQLLRGWHGPTNPSLYLQLHCCSHAQGSRMLQQMPYISARCAGLPREHGSCWCPACTCSAAGGRWQREDWGCGHGQAHAAGLPDK
jgi:hypothetical protein